MARCPAVHPLAARVHCVRVGRAAHLEVKDADAVVHLAQNLMLGVEGQLSRGGVACMPNFFDLTPDAPRKRPRKAGDLPALQRVLWFGVLESEALPLKGSTSPEHRLKAIHALATIGGAYARLLEVSELEKRLSALEQRLVEHPHGAIP